MSLNSFKRDESGKFIPTKNFKMPRRLKYMFAAISNKETRDHMKGLMAQAVMQSFEVVESKKKKATGTQPVEL